MLIPFEELSYRHKMKVNGVLHVGAHDGEEAPEYNKLGWGKVWWVEADPAVVPRLRNNVSKFGHEVIEGVVYNESGKKLTFNVANNEQSSSILEFGTHSSEHPEVKFTRTFEVETITIDDLVSQYDIKANFLNLDIQGAEFLALVGAEQFLENVDYIYSEINIKPLYKNSPLVDRIDMLLSKNFVRADTLMTVHGWGDALYVRKFK